MISVYLLLDLAIPIKEKLWWFESAYDNKNGDSKEPPFLL